MATATVIEQVLTGTRWFCNREVREAVRLLKYKSEQDLGCLREVAKERDDLLRKVSTASTRSEREAALEEEVERLKGVIESQKESVKKTRGLEAALLRAQQSQAELANQKDRETEAHKRAEAAYRKKVSDLETEVVDAELALDAKEKVLRQAEVDLANANETVRQYQEKDARTAERLRKVESERDILEHNHERVMEALRALVGEARAEP